MLPVIRASYFYLILTLIGAAKLLINTIFDVIFLIVFTKYSAHLKQKVVSRKPHKFIVKIFPYGCRIYSLYTTKSYMHINVLS